MAKDKDKQEFSSWTELIKGVPQGSVLGPLLFNIYLNDLVYLAQSTEVYNFADETTFFGCHKDLKTLISRLEHDSHWMVWKQLHETKSRQTSSISFRI